MGGDHGRMTWTHFKHEKEDEVDEIKAAIHVHVEKYLCVVETQISIDFAVVVVVSGGGVDSERRTHSIAYGYPLVEKTSDLT